jgi:starvation-inducible DNA-binding protein
MKANIGISEEHNSATALILNTLLADEQVLYVKTKNYHWNVTGSSFNDLHVFFDKQAEELEEIIDEVAERMRSLGHFAIGTMKDYLKLTRLLEHDSKMDDAITLVQNLLADHETIIKTLRNEIPVVGEKYKDIGTNDFLTGKLQQHEKMAWMLRAYLK